MSNLELAFKFSRPMSHSPTIYASQVSQNKAAHIFLNLNALFISPIGGVNG